MALGLAPAGGRGCRRRPVAVAAIDRIGARPRPDPTLWSYDGAARSAAIVAGMVQAASVAPERASPPAIAARHRRRCASGGATTMPAATTSGSFRSCGGRASRRAGGAGRGPRLAGGAMPRANSRRARARRCFSTASRLRSRATTAKKIELGGHAERAPLLTYLGRGRELLAEAFGSRFVPAPCAALESDRSRRGGIATGYRVYRPRPSGRGRCPMRPRGCGWTTRIWTSWSGAMVPARLDQGRPSSSGRTGVAHGEEPIGILSHHQVMDAAAFATLDRLLALVQDHPRATLAAAGALFGGR